MFKRDGAAGTSDLRSVFRVIAAGAICASIAIEAFGVSTTIIADLGWGAAAGIVLGALAKVAHVV